MKKMIFWPFLLLAVACQSPQKQPWQADTEKASMKGSPMAELNDLFDVVNVVKMHLYATEEATPTGESYPYVGQPIPESLFGYLGSELQPRPGEVFAC